MLENVRNFFLNPKFQKTTFWTFTSSLFLLSSLALTVSVTTNTHSQQSLNSSAYTPGSTNIVDMSHYISKFGFYSPTATYSIGNPVFQRLKAMMPYAFAGADAYNRATGESVEPELIVWWSYAEGIGGNVSFSNCNDSYYGIGNCYYPSSWQLGYGIQFSAIGLLKSAFTNIHGNPDNPHLVAQVGQNVLNIDMANNTSPHCGGYSCTFPQMTVDQIMSGVSTSYETQNNWWASVLSRDPGINAYINSEALRIERFNRQLAWGWGSYYRNNWQLYSNYLSTILSHWVSLGGCAANTNCFIVQPTAEPTSIALGFITPTDTPVPTDTPQPTQKPTATPSPTIFPTPTEIPTQYPTLVATDVPTETPTPTQEPTETPTDTPTEDMTPTIATVEPTEIALVVSPTLQPTAAITVAPIAKITPEPTIIVPTIQPPSQEYIAGQRISSTVELLSTIGILLSLFLSIPITRRKIFSFFLFLVGRRKTTDEKGVAMGNIQNLPANDASNDSQK